MQQFTKSLGSFTWALSLFGVQQTLNMLRPIVPQSGVHPATEAFQALTDVAVDQLGGTTKRTFQTLNFLQRQTLDVGFSILDVGFSILLPRRSMSSLGDLGQQTAGQVQQWTSSLCPQSRSSQAAACGPVQNRQ